MDFAAAGLLEGLEGEDRAARAQLLEQLSRDGVSLEELRAAIDEDRLALLPVERVLGGKYSAKEIERRTGLPADIPIWMRRLQGLPEAGRDDRVFGDEDIEAARSTKLFLDSGFDRDAVAEVTRVLGESMSRVASTITASFVETFLSPGDSEQDVALRFAELAEQLTPAVTPALVATFSAHLRENVRRGILGRTELEAGGLPGAQDMVVCFADLVGFTRLGGQVEALELGAVARQLAELAADVVEAPVRLVKTIGDAAMFVSPEAEPLVQTALGLLEAVEEAELPSLRAGVALGPALLRAGDYYGHAVNLASRVTGIARPGSVLCTEEVRDAAPEAFEWSFAGKHRLKGVGHELALHRARRAGPSDAPPEAQSRRRDASSQRADRRRRRAPSSRES
jgi:adenylate cyclase